MLKRIGARSPWPGFRSRPRNVKIPSMNRVTLGLGQCLLVWMLMACGSGSPRSGVSVDAAWARATPPGVEVGAVYMTLRNDDAEPLRVVAVECAVADRAEFHEMVHADGMLRMRQLEDGLLIEAGRSRELSPGGLHLMLLGLHAPLEAGQQITLRLLFEDGRVMEVAVPVRRDAPRV